MHEKLTSSYVWVYTLPLCQWEPLPHHLGSAFLCVDLVSGRPSPCGLRQLPVHPPSLAALAEREQEEGRDGSSGKLEMLSPEGQWVLDGSSMPYSLFPQNSSPLVWTYVPVLPLFPSSWKGKWEVAKR